MLYTRGVVVYFELREGHLKLAKINKKKKNEVKWRVVCRHQWRAGLAKLRNKEKQKKSWEGKVKCGEEMCYPRRERKRELYWKESIKKWAVCVCVYDREGLEEML